MIAKPGRDPADLGREDRQRAGAERQQQQRPQAVDDRPRGLQLGQRVLVRARREQPRDRCVASLRAPSTLPISVASTHQPAHT